MFLRVKGVFIWERLRKMCTLIMNFRDKGPFENLPDTHGNIAFDLSDPPPPGVQVSPPYVNNDHSLTSFAKK